jgi:F-type H+-transporting ATPase subunit delta
MQWLHELIKDSRDFVTLLRSPVINPGKKQQIVDAVIKKHISTITNSFIHLLIVKGRESNLPEIITAYISQYKAHKNIHTIRLTTASPINDELKKTIVDQIKKTSEMQNIELETVIDKDLIGGFVLEAGDKLIDASIAYELKRISRSFENNDFVYRIR